MTDPKPKVTSREMVELASLIRSKIKCLFLPLLQCKVISSLINQAGVKSFNLGAKS